MTPNREAGRGAQSADLRDLARARTEALLPAIQRAVDAAVRDICASTGHGTVEITIKANQGQPTVVVRGGPMTVYPIEGL